MLRGQLNAAGVSAAMVCPENHVAIIKSVVLANPTAAPVLAAVTLRHASGTFQLDMVQVTLAAGSRQMLDCWVVMDQLDNLFVYGAAAGLQYWISGSVLFPSSSFDPPPNLTRTVSPLPVSTG